MKQYPSVSLQLENLEERLTPAFTSVYSPFTATWTLTQTASNGDVLINTSGGNLILTDGANPAQVLGASGASLTVNMISGTGDELTIDLDDALTGNLTLNLNNGDRNVFVGGDDGSVFGNMNINAGSGDQSVSLATDAIFSGVGGSLSINLGLGDDTVAAINDLSVGSDLTLRGANFFDHFGALFVGRNVAMYNNMENTSGGIGALAVNGTTTIGGNLTYLGGSQDDQVFLVDGVTIGGNLYVNLGSNFSTVFVDQVRLEDFGGGSAVIGGNVTVIGGENPFVSDVYQSDDSTSIGGNLYINFGGGAGGGISSATAIRGAIGGSSLTIITGSGVDNVTYANNSGTPRVYASLGAGDDTFELSGDAAASYMYIDFGVGNDTWLPGGVSIFWPLVLRNLP